MALGSMLLVLLLVGLSSSKAAATNTPTAEGRPAGIRKLHPRHVASRRHLSADEMDAHILPVTNQGGCKQGGAREGAGLSHCIASELQSMYDLSARQVRSRNPGLCSPCTKHAPWHPVLCCPPANVCAACNHACLCSHVQSPARCPCTAPACMLVNAHTKTYTGATDYCAVCVRR